MQQQQQAKLECPNERLREDDNWFSLIIINWQLIVLNETKKEKKTHMTKKNNDNKLTSKVRHQIFAIHIQVL